MRESILTHTTRSLGRLALAAVLAAPLSFATARTSAPPPKARAPKTQPPVTAGMLFSGPSIAGRARVIDGDTIDISGVRVRLEGIDAPERGQTCGRRGGGNWRCGAAATKALKKMVAGRTVTCDSRGTGKYGRMLGVCFAGGREINAQMVRRGLAWAFVKYSGSYRGVEATAKALKVGIWQGEAQPAWEYRAGRWAVAEGDAPDGCAIKGNISRRGRIYHMPWSQWYARTKIEPAKGERWFCSESDAQASGWRPVAVR